MFSFAKQTKPTCFCHLETSKKSDVVAKLLLYHGYDKSESIFIGDALSDMLAAQSNRIEFLLKKTALNSELQKSYNGPKWFSIANESACSS